MASLLSFVKKKTKQIERNVGRVVAQVNPADNGRTWQNPQGNPQRPQPQQQPIMRPNTPIQIGRQPVGQPVQPRPTANPIQQVVNPAVGLVRSQIEGIKNAPLGQLIQHGTPGFTKSINQISESLKPQQTKQGMLKANPNIINAAMNVGGGRGLSIKKAADSKKFAKNVQKPNAPFPPPAKTNPPQGVKLKNGGVQAEQGSTPAVEQTLQKIMKTEGLDREASTKKMDSYLRASVAPDLKLESAAPLDVAPVLKAKSPEVKTTLQTLSRGQRQANVEQGLVSATIERAAKQHKVNPADPGLIKRYQTNTITSPNEKAFASQVKQETDKLYKVQQSLDPEIPYRQNYLPGAYAQDAPAVEQAIRQLKTKTNNNEAKVFGSYEEAKGFGLSPRYDNIQDLLGTTARKAKQAQVTRQAVDEGINSGVFTTSPLDRNYRQVEGLYGTKGEPLFAHGDVANRINATYQKPTEAVGKTIAGAAKLSGAAQEIALTGGIPNTYGNAFGFSQIFTQGAGYLRPSAIKDAFYATNKASTQKRFTSTKSVAPGLSTPDFIREVAAKGGNINPVRNSAANAEASGVRKFGNVASGQEATFAQLMPNFQLSIAEATYKKFAKKRGHDEAIQIAADTVNMATGFVDEAGRGRSTNTRNAMTAGLFASRYRESVIGQLANAVKGWAPKNLKDPSYRYSRRFAVGLLGTAALYDQANVKATGHHMWDNRPGQELSVQIPVGEKDAKGNQPVINIPLFPSTLTVPRAVVNGVIAGLRGDPKGVGAEATKFLATPLQVGGQLLTNKDYFSRPIFNDATTAQNEGTQADSPAEAAKKIGLYGAKQLTPGWVRAGIDYATGKVDPSQKKPTGQIAAQAFEAPVRFGKDLNPDTTAYFKALETARGRLNKNEQASFDALHPKKKNVFGDEIFDTDSIYKSVARLDAYNNYPAVFGADKSIDQASRKRGNPGNPLFDLQGGQVKKVLEKDNLPPGADDKELSKLREQPWYVDYSAKKSDFFSKIKQKLDSQLAQAKKTKDTQGIKAVQESVDKFNNPTNPYPVTPAPVQKVIDQYTALPKGTGARSKWIRSNPGDYKVMQDQFLAIDNWQNTQRERRGLAATEGKAGEENGFVTPTTNYATSSTGRKSTNGSLARGRGSRVARSSGRRSSGGTKTAKIKAPKITIAKAKKISVPKGVKVKKLASKSLKTKKLPVSKIPKVKVG